MTRHHILFGLLVLSLLRSPVSFAQDSPKKDTVIENIKNDVIFSDPNDKGVTLIKNENYQEANSFFSSEIKKNEADRDAYFKRGIANWELSDTMNACRDWSAVLAMGDTATFLLLDSKCHGAMVVGEDTIHSKQYHKMFSGSMNDSKIVFAEPNKDSKTYDYAQEMPLFPGGEEALIQYMKKNLHYPAAAVQNGTQGRVYVNFMIGKKGQVLFPYAVRGPGNGCNEEAIRIIRNMPPWKPGKVNGKPVVVRYNLPVNFALK